MSILEQADKVSLSPSAQVSIGVMQDRMQLDNSRELADSLAFGPLEDMGVLLTYFGMKFDDLLDTSTSDKMKFIYGNKGDQHIYNYLLDMGSKLGGRLSGGLLNKMYAYLTIADRKSQIADEYGHLSKEMDYITSNNNNV